MDATRERDNEREQRGGAVRQVRECNNREKDKLVNVEERERERKRERERERETTQRER